MDRIDTPHATQTKPPYTPAGTPGFFQDSDPAGATELSAAFLNAVQEEIVNVLAHAGVSRDKLRDDQLVEAIGGAAALRSLASAMLTAVTTLHDRAVLVSQGSLATGPKSLVAGSKTARASGTEAAVIASEGLWGFAEASGDRSVVGATKGGVASGESAALFGSQNVELATDFAVGGGYETTSTEFTPAGVNQYLKWLIRSVEGSAHFADQIRAGGNPGTGASATVTIDGATGDVDADGRVTAGELVITGGAVRADADGNVDADGAISVAGKATCTGGLALGSGHTGNTASTVNLAPGAWGEISTSNAKIGPSSIILWSLVLTDASSGDLVQGPCEHTTGSASFRIQNAGSSTFNAPVNVQYVIVNPL